MAVALAACLAGSAAASAAAGSQLPTFLRSSAGELQAAAEEPNVLAPVRLIQVAADFVRRSGQAKVTGGPLGGMLLRDLDARPVALAVVFPVGGDAPSAATLRQQLADVTAAIVEGLAAEGEPNPLRLVQELRQADRSLTVTTGAAVTERRLLSMRAGLPSQVYMALGRHRVAAAAKAELEQVKLRRAFFEPRMQRGNHEGAIYSVAGKGEFVYFYPSVGSPFGHARPLGVFFEARRKVLDEMTRELAAAREYRGELDAAARERLYLEQNARQWGRHLAFLDATRSGVEAKLCHACTDRASELLAEGRTDFWDHVLAGDDEAECDCTMIYLDGDRVPVASCEEFSEQCCEWDGDEFIDTGECLSGCECECDGEEWKVIDYPVHLRGVPTLFQHDVPVDPFTVYVVGLPAVAACDTEVAVGCGPIAISELLIWYDQLGWDGILADYRTATDEVEWRDLAEDLRDGYLGSFCWGEVTATTLGEMESGFEAFVRDLGLSVDVTHEVIKSADEVAGWVTIRSEINANRPLMLGYNTDGKDGIASGWVDHYGLISGYSDVLGSKIIYVVTGWGAAGNESYEWDIPANKVHLYTVEMGNAGSGGPGWCAAIGNVSDYYAEDDGKLGYSASKASYDDWPLLEDLSGTTPPDCDRIGGTVEGFFDAHWTERYHCLTPFQKKRIDESVAEFQERLEATTEPLDQIDPWPW